MQQKREIRWESGGSESWGKWDKYDQNSLYAILKGLIKKILKFGGWRDNLRASTTLSADWGSDLRTT